MFVQQHALHLMAVFAQPTCHLLGKGIGRDEFVEAKADPFLTDGQSMSPADLALAGKEEE